jgi:serine/threonine protein kinase
LSAPLESGRTVGRYRIVDFLGAGAMGEVYLAEDPQIERRLAIKTVRLAGRPQEVDDRKKRLLREARAAGRLLHPNIVMLFDAGEDQGLLFLAFELVEGMDLAGRLEKGPALSLREVLRIVRQTAEALDYAHHMGIVHRDIKPSNILLDTAGRVKVADFGIAKMAGQSTELTVAGSVMGSPQYLSPEQIRGEELDGRSDIFSLGVLLYELLSRKRPFEGDTITTLVYQILHKEPPPVSELRQIPERLEMLLRRMLAKNRDERFASAAAVAAEVGEVERELNDETLSAPAANLPGMEPTRLLPRSGPAAVVPPPPPPQSPQLSQMPPPLPPQPGTALPAGPPPPPAQTTGRTQVARAGLGLAAVLGIAGVIFILFAGTAVWFLVFRKTGPPDTTRQAPEVAQQVPVQRQAEGGPGILAERPEETKAPATTLDVPQTPRRTEPQATAPQLPRAEPQPVRPDRAPPSPSAAPSPAPITPEVRRPVPTPPAPAPAVPDEPAPEAAPVERVPGPARAADRVVRSGLALEFRVTPPDAMVLVDGTVIGRALEWSGGKRNRTYTLPGAGDYEVKIRAQGLREVRLLVQASEAGGVTPIFARLAPLAAVEAADASDLRTVQVREAVAFRVEPPVAAILVDGQPAGPARQFSGRPLQPRTWLKLPAGTHRVSVIAPGRERQDILVEVTPGATKERDHIAVTLSPGGHE